MKTEIITKAVCEFCGRTWTLQNDGRYRHSYQCRDLGKSLVYTEYEYATLEKIKKHEQECDGNPINKQCSSCANHLDYPPFCKRANGAGEQFKYIDYFDPLDKNGHCKAWKQQAK